MKGKRKMPPTKRYDVRLQFMTRQKVFELVKMAANEKDISISQACREIFMKGLLAEGILTPSERE